MTVYYIKDIIASIEEYEEHENERRENNEE